MDKDQLKNYAKRLQYYVDEMDKEVSDQIYPSVRLRGKWAALKGYLSALTEMEYEK